MEIKPFDFADSELLEPLVDAFSSSHTTLSFRSDYQVAFRDWIKRISTHPETTVIIAKDGIEIVGMAVGTIIENGPLILPDKIGYIPIFVVSSQFRRKGVGKRLSYNMDDWFCSKGVKEVQLYTQITNDDSRSFWKYCGFDVVLERRKKRIGSKSKYNRR